METAVQGGTFQSWVMTDQDEEVVFALRGGRLELTGAPYYYFWTSNVEEGQEAQQRLESQALEQRRAGRIAEHNRIVEQIHAMAPTVSELKSRTRRMGDARGAVRP